MMVFVKDSKEIGTIVGGINENKLDEVISKIIW